MVCALSLGRRILLHALQAHQRFNGSAPDVAWHGQVQQRFNNSALDVYSQGQVGGDLPTDAGLATPLSVGILRDVPLRPGLVKATKIATSLEQVAARHPCWEFAWKAIWNWQAYETGAILFFAGMLCSAGGIGGGAIFVMLLLVVGGLEISDAVPLSKAIIFVGSFSSLPLTVRRALAPDPTHATLIDFNICRLVIPAALLGTYVGVLLNRMVPDWAILLVLAVVLTGMSCTVLRTTWRQFQQESRRLMRSEEASGASGRPSDESAPNSPANSELPSPSKASGKRSKLQHVLAPQDTITVLLMLVAVVGFGVFRTHAGACQRAPLELRSEVCHHPALFFLGDALEVWMRQNSRTANLATSLAFSIPLSTCLSVLVYYSRWLSTNEDWQIQTIMQYSAMAIAAGCLAGLVGIGGGLIFAPFFLVMGVDPSTTVATSSLCVMFTSASTALQFLLTDRIIMTLLVLYGSVNVVAFNLGTFFIHFLRDNFSARKSYISAVIASGVVLSTVMSVMKLISELGEATSTGGGG